jgi:hypothetical protein
MLSINDVTKIDEKRKHIKKEIYKKIYEQFSRKIKKSVELGNKQIFLTIPAFLVGFPVFDRAVAAQYIARQFKNGGFNVSIVGEYEIYINWIIEKPKKDKPRQDIVDESEFPDLMNLKKMANKYRK